MKINLLFKISIVILIISCKNKPETSNKIENIEETTQQIEETNQQIEETNQQIEETNQQIEESKAENYTLQKITGLKNKDNPDYLIYERKEDDYTFTFYTKSTIKYGVLEKYINEIDRSDYYIFQKKENLNQQLTINLKDALFVKKSNELDPEYPDYTELNLLLKNYVIIGFRGDPSYPTYAIINVKKQTVSNFDTRGDFEVLPGEQFLIGWKDSEINVNMETICPEHKDMIDNYTVTEEFKYNLATGNEKLTGKLGCGFVQ